MPISLFSAFAGFIGGFVHLHEKVIACLVPLLFVGPGSSLHWIHRSALRFGANQLATLEEAGYIIEGSLPQDPHHVTFHLL